MEPGVGDGEGIRGGAPALDPVGADSTRLLLLLQTAAALGPGVGGGSDGEGPCGEASALVVVGNSAAAMAVPVIAVGGGGVVEGHTAPDPTASRVAASSSMLGPGVRGGVGLPDLAPMRGGGEPMATKVPSLGGVRGWGHRRRRHLPWWA